MGKVLAFVGVLVVAGALVFWKMTGSEETGEMTAAPKNTKGTDDTNMKATEKKLTSKTEYQNPSGKDEVGFNVMVNSEGVVTGVTVDVLAVNEISKKRQEAFAAELPQVLVGKKLAELAPVDRVGGSSLTTNAFNMSLVELKANL